MAPPAAANSAKPPMGVWVGVLGKLGWAKIIVEKTTISKMIYKIFIASSENIYKSGGTTGTV